ncbi:MAG: M48 family metallopeptidase [Bacteroidetes bacterium]|nr:M48 family metallopeptidase [Bacteroidota bacterium]
MIDLTSFERTCEQVRFSVHEPYAEVASASSSYSLAHVRLTGLQVTSTSVPILHRALERAAASLMLDVLPEIYVVAQTEPNAHVFSHGSARSPVVVVNSGLVQLLRPPELEFVLAHELAHFGLRHDAQARSQSMQRNAEISADRVALVACKSLTLCTRVMITMASGLPMEYLGLDIDTFVRQLDVDADEAARRWEFQSTHPALPFRLWALLRFSHSDVFARLSGQGMDGLPLEQIDDQIDARASTMHREDDAEDTTYATALAWHSVRKVLQGGKVDADGYSDLVKKCGSDYAYHVTAIALARGPEAVAAQAKRSLQRLQDTHPELARKLLSA